jgi:chemotaxis signal transduction protein
MSTAGSELLGKVAEMRRQFDESFARPRPHHLPAGESMLAIVVRGEPFAVRLAETAGLAALEGKILPVPSEAKELLGLIGHRGTVVPVFSLAALLGYSSGTAAPHWLLFCRGPAPLGLAFEQLERQFSANPAEVCTVEGSRTQAYIQQTVQDGARLRIIIRLDALAEHIQRRPTGR